KIKSIVLICIGCLTSLAGWADSTHGKKPVLDSSSITRGTCAAVGDQCVTTVTCKWKCEASTPTSTCSPQDITTNYTGTCITSPVGGGNIQCGAGPAAGNACGSNPT